MPTSPMVKFMPEPNGARNSKPSAAQAAGAYLKKPQGAPRMEITVQSLFGVACPCNDEGRTATISFSGSVPDMQVGSSTFDPFKGVLVVESMPLRPGGRMLEWPKDRPPHLTVNLEERKALDAKTNLQKANRDSEIVSREAVAEVYRYSRLNSAKSATASVFWSDKTIPDIVEMSIRFGEFQGVSYLVFFGHKDDLGTCIMDLPVRTNTGHFCSDLHPNAKIRVKVTVIIPDVNDGNQIEESNLPPVIACSTSLSEDTLLKVPFSRSYLEDQIAPLMAIIRNNEENAESSRYFQTHNVNVEVPHSVDYNDTQADRISPSRSFCSLSIWEKLRQTVAACSGSGDVLDYHEDSWSCESSTVGSTIATRESWDL